MPEQIVAEPSLLADPPEWLLADGRGGFAMGAVDGTRRRRYHGLLVAALVAPLRRVVALAGLVESIVIDGRRFELARHRFAGTVEEPTEGVALVECAVDRHLRHVRWRWTVPGGTVERVLRMRGADEIDAGGSVGLAWELGGAAATAPLLVRPLVPLRDFHELPWGDPPALEVVERGRDGVVIGRDDAGDGGPRLRLQASAEGGIAWHDEPDVWRRFAYEEDRRRGQDWQEDVASPGWFELCGPSSLTEQATSHRRLDATCGASGSPEPVEAPPRPRPVEHPARLLDDDRLAAAARQFVVRHDRGPGGTTVIAGYPWFSDWGRDALIALVGLLLVPPVRQDEARSVLETMAAHLRDGLVPNCFDDDGRGAVHHTADASLWYLVAVGAYHRRTGCGGAGGVMLDACEAIIDAYRAGTRFGIAVDDDGLVVAGDGGHPVTWMDARRGGISFTPRVGKPVELSILWHEGLLAFARTTPKSTLADELEQEAKRTAASIRARFPWPERRCLHDCLESTDEGWRPDGRLRPNQIFGASLPHSPVARDDQRRLVATVREELLTPCGLRTLSRDHPEYRGRYEGDLMERDAAYHNGTVWPWLLGPYCEAVLRTEPDREVARAHVNESIGALLATLDDDCIGQLAEIFDGDPPHRPSGCPAQAWSIAEARRIRSLLAAGL